MAEFNEDAQHPATAIRMQQAIRDGDAPRSLELAAAIQLTIGVTILYLLSTRLSVAIADFTITSWQPIGITTESIADRLAVNAEKFGATLAITLLPVLGAILVGVLLSHLLQVGSAFGLKKSIWRPDQSNPVQGLKRLLSLDNLMRGVLGIPKIAIVVLVTTLMIWNQRVEIVGLQFINTKEMGLGLMHQIFLALISACGTLLAVSIFDYLVQWYSFQSRLKMTDQQLRDENRLQSPDPHLKHRRIELFEQISDRSK